MSKPARKLRLARHTIKYYERDLAAAPTPERRAIVERRYREACIMIALWKLTGEKPRLDSLSRSFTEGKYKQPNNNES